MIKNITQFLICLLLFISCNNIKKSTNGTISSTQKTKLTTFSAVIKKQNTKSDSELLLKELSTNYPKKYTCAIAPESTLLGDINKDGLEDVLFRYTVDDMENQTWLACGWFIAFSNNKNEFDKYIYYDWSSGRCAQSQFDLGFPTSIVDGIISSSIDDYDTNDGCCCPSLKRSMQFTYDKEFNFLSPSKIETIKQSNHE